MFRYQFTHTQIHFAVLSNHQDTLDSTNLDPNHIFLTLKEDHLHIQESIQRGESSFHRCNRIPFEGLRNFIHNLSIRHRIIQDKLSENRHILDYTNLLNYQKRMNTLAISDIQYIQLNSHYRIPQKLIF